jgi:uncharacterized protein YlxW (UPF0749 family)
MKKPSQSELDAEDIILRAERLRQLYEERAKLKSKINELKNSLSATRRRLIECGWDIESALSGIIGKRDT